MNAMRNIIFYTIATFLFLGSIGFNVFKHICPEDGIIVSYVIPQSDEHCSDEEIDACDTQLTCCNESSEKEKDCCSNEFDFFQLKLDYLNHFDSFIFLGVQSISFNGFTLNNTAIITEKVVVSNYPNPPPLSGKEILIEKQVFII